MKIKRAIKTLRMINQLFRGEDMQQNLERD